MQERKYGVKCKSKLEPGRNEFIEGTNSTYWTSVVWLLAHCRRNVCCSILNLNECMIERKYLETQRTGTETKVMRAFWISSLKVWRRARVAGSGVFDSQSAILQENTETTNDWNGEFDWNGELLSLANRDAIVVVRSFSSLTKNCTSHCSHAAAHPHFMRPPQWLGASWCRKK